MPWVVYKLERNGRFPNPTAEVDALIEISGQDPANQPWIKLSYRDNPPGVGERFGGSTIYLCTPNEDRTDLIIIARARIPAEAYVSRNTLPPMHLQSVYEQQAGNFLRIGQIGREEQGQTATAVGILSKDEVAAFLAGQAYCKHIDRPFPVCSSAPMPYNHSAKVGNEGGGAAMKIDEILARHSHKEFPKDADVRARESDTRYKQLQTKWKPKIGDGWYGFSLHGVPLSWIEIIDEFLDHVAAVDPDFEIHQIKLKIGRIRFYVRCRDELRPEIEKLEAELFSEDLIY